MNMRRFTMTMALVATMVVPVFAERVTPETARMVATTFLNNNGAKTTQLTDLSKTAGFENLYIFTTESSFVVMSADDCVKPILGYSFNGKFVIEGMPDNLYSWLQGYSDEIQYAIDNQIRANSEVTNQWKNLLNGKPNTEKKTVVVDALITTKWNQRAPFNNLCPSNGSSHAVTGCVATAMAQIMNYHKWPSVGIGQHSYTHPTYGEQIANFSQTNYEWNNMKDSYGNGYTTAEANAVATLLYHCGVSVNMEYGTSSSGAFSSDIPSALINYFNYSVSVKFKSRYPSDSTAFWIAELKTELDRNRPMEYHGTGSGGHSFVCDGYDSDDNFHFNWGWANNNDGFFSIDAMTPGSHNYNFEQGAIFGIKPTYCNVSSPATFTANLVEGTRNVSLNWDAVTNAVNYKLFRNGTLIKTVQANETMSYIDSHIPYGTNVYYIRCVDSEGEMSLPTEYKTITLLFPAPTQLEASVLPNRHVSLTWVTSPNATSYNVYCNEVRIASNVTSTTYEDNCPIPTNPSYYVKGVDTYGDESEASPIANVSISYRTPVVNNINTTLSKESVTLSWSVPSWCYPQNETQQLSYGDGSPSYFYDIKYYAHRHPVSSLSQYIGLSIYKISTRISAVGTYTIYIYTKSVNDLPDPASIADTRVLTCTQGGWRDIPLSEPIAITEETDLWIVIKQENTDQTHPVPSFNLSVYNGNACYASNSSPTNLSRPGSNIKISWFIKAYLTDGTYTYNLYDNGIKVNGDTPISDTSYMISNISDNTLHQYTIKTNYYGGESEASNKAYLAKGTTSLETLDLSDDNMTIAQNSTLTVGSLTNSDPANLILENGAQLIHNSTGVKATVKKDVAAYTSKLDGWNLIASPVTENITPSGDNGLFSALESDTIDLYYYSEPEHKWKNYQKQTFSIEHQKGYLYANNKTDGTTLSFVGTLTPNNEAVTIRNLSYSATTLNGINLVGNPFVCNAIVNKDFYVMNEDRTRIVVPASDRQIAPCEGIFVQVSEADPSVTFTKAGAKSRSLSSSFDLTLTQGHTTLDRARVRFEDKEGLEKFSLNENTGNQIYFPQDRKGYAVACISEQNELPLNFEAAENGTYTLNIETNDTDLDYLHLIDNFTGNDVDLLTTPDYTFEAKTSDYPSRFRLVFSDPCENTNDDDAAPFAYVSNGNIVITGVDGDAGSVSLQIVDMLGHVIVSQGDVSGNISTANMPAGVYVLHLSNAQTTRTQKIVVQ